MYTEKLHHILPAFSTVFFSINTNFFLDKFVSIRDSKLNIRDNRLNIRDSRLNIRDSKLNSQTQLTKLDQPGCLKHFFPNIALEGAASILKMRKSQDVLQTPHIEFEGQFEIFAAF